MPQPAYKTCRNCGRHASEVGEMSWTRLCIECSEEIKRMHDLQMHLHVGPHFERWRARMAASVGAILIEDLEGKHGR